MHHEAIQQEAQPRLGRAAAIANHGVRNRFAIDIAHAPSPDRCLYRYRPSLKRCQLKIDIFEKRA
jgi:hypothetical protein